MQADAATLEATEKELERTIPLISKIRSNFPEVVISIDTTKSEVAEQAILSGANTGNPSFKSITASTSPR